MIIPASSTSRRNLLKSITLLAIVLAWPATPLLAQDSETLLKGTVRHQDYYSQTPAPSLNRRDLKPNSDAFGGDPASNQVINQELSPPSFDVQQMQLPMPPPQQQRNFPLRANMNDFDGAPMDGMQDQGMQPPEIVPQQPRMSMMPPQMMRPQVMPPALRAQDPDSSPELQLAWDAWHRRVAAAIYERFNAMAQLAFRYSRPLAAYVSYTVTRDGRVINVQLQQKSPNIAFNTMLLLVVNSLSGQRELLAFPQGSRRMTVEKGGMFTQNYGQQGFKFTTGDRETIRPH